MSSGTKRPLSEAGAMQQHGGYGLRDTAKRRHTMQHGQHQPSQRSAQRRMLPPPQPSTMESDYDPCHLGLASSEMAHNFLPSPGLQQKTDYPSSIEDLGNYLPDDQAAAMRSMPPSENLSINHHPAPWVPIHDAIPQSNMNYSRLLTQSKTFGTMSDPTWPTPTSDLEGSLPGRDRPDSTYYSQTIGSESTLYEPQVSNIDCQSVTGRMNDMELRENQKFQSAHQQTTQFPFSQYSPRPSESSQQQQVEFPHDNFKCDEQDCPFEAVKQSEIKKHKKLRHERPFYCDVQGCDWKKGFPSFNDLERHKGSKHGFITGKVFKCAAKHCSKKHKAWPRADNFRQHIKRLHPQEDVQEIMEKSWDLGNSQFGRELAPFMEPLSQESPYLNPSNPSFLVAPQDLAACPSDDAQMNLYQQDREVSHYSVNGSHEATYMYSMPGQDVTQIFTLDPAMTKQHLAADQEQFRAQQVKRLLATPSSRRPKGTSSSHSKVTPVIDYPESSPKDSGSLSVDERTMSDHSSSKPLNPTTDEDQVASHIMEKFLRNPDALQMIIKTFIKTNGTSLPDPKKLRKRGPVNAPLRDTLSFAQARFKCPKCDKTKKTQCDLKKHEKRHTRPYGCTYTACPRRFGSKDDWKRHENTMHWQVEAWKCAQSKPRSTGISSVGSTGSKDKATNKRRVVSKTMNQCGKVFYRREQFQAHLSTDHKISDDIYVKEQCKIRRIGRNGHEGFWCGFCQNVIMVEKKNQEAFDERFTHIDSQHFDKGERVETWFPIQGELPKGLLSAPAERSDKEEEFEGPVSDVDDGEDSGSDPEDDIERISEEPTQQPAHLHVLSQKDPPTAQTNALSNHRGKDKKTSQFCHWYCCQCMQPGGDLGSCSGGKCQNCFHERCSMCKVEYHQQ